MLEKSLNAFLMGLFVAATVLFLGGCRQQESGSAVAELAAGLAADPDGYMEVDCLLPGQVRKLGTMVYASPRRPVKTTASDCTIRGGEYVLYDRANYKEALAVWMVEAEGGDGLAQSYVGEIYLRSPPGKPRYDLAAKWFERAAKNGNKRAQVNLAYLYENGLGVPKDQDKAARWYARASGADPSSIIQSQQLSPEERAEYEALKEENRRQLAEIEHLNQNRQQVERQLAVASQQLEKRKQEIALKQRLADARRAEILSLSARLEESRVALATRSERLEAQIGQLKDKLSAQEIEAQRREEQLALSRQSAVARKRESAELTAALGAEYRTKLETLLAELKEREKQLAFEREQAAILSREIEKRKREEERVKTELASLTSKLADLPGPKIELFDPQLLRTRGIIVAPVEPAVSRSISGIVWTPVGLQSFLINGHQAGVDGDGKFKADIPLAAKEQEIQLVATDSNGKKEELRFLLQQFEKRDADGASREVGAGRTADIPFGRYYALVIGNNDYRQLPGLKTAVEDARVIGKLLRDNYGFEVKTLFNADRATILSTLNEYRKKLTEHDNLLIYYAGHGTLEERNTQGFWLPVDSSPDDDVNWIPTDRITGIMNLMSAKQIMVVADACYSGIMTRAALTRLESGKSKEAYVTWLKKMASYKSRVIISSGETKPVLDGGGGKHSVFARAFIDTLKTNRKILLGIDLHRAIAERVVDISGRIGHIQVPQYAGLNRAGHELGDFLFVPRSAKTGKSG